MQYKIKVEYAPSSRAGTEVFTIKIVGGGDGTYNSTGTPVGIMPAGGKVQVAGSTLRLFPSSGAATIMNLFNCSYVTRSGNGVVFKTGKSEVALTWVRLLTDD